MIKKNWLGHEFCNLFENFKDKDSRLTERSLVSAFLFIVKLQFQRIISPLGSTRFYSLSHLNSAHNPFLIEDFNVLDRPMRFFQFSFFLLNLFVLVLCHRFVLNRSAILAAYYIHIALSEGRNQCGISVVGFGFLEEIKVLIRYCELLGVPVEYYEPRCIIGSSNWVICNTTVLAYPLTAEILENKFDDRNFTVASRVRGVSTPLSIGDFSSAISIFYSSGYKFRVGDLYNDEYLEQCLREEAEAIANVAAFLEKKGEMLLVAPHYFRGVEEYQSAKIYYEGLASNIEVLEKSPTVLDQIAYTYSSNIIGDMSLRGIPFFIIGGAPDQIEFLSDVSLKNSYLPLNFDEMVLAELCEELGNEC